MLMCLPSPYTVRLVTGKYPFLLQWSGPVFGRTDLSQIFSFVLCRRILFAGFATAFFLAFLCEILDCLSSVVRHVDFLGGREQYHILPHNLCGSWWFFCLLGLTSFHVQNLNTTTPSLSVLFVSNEQQAFRDTIRRYFARFRLKMCYCSWPPKVSHLSVGLAKSSRLCTVGTKIIADPEKCFQELIRGERTWAIAIRPFYANQSSELNFPTFRGKNGPNSEEGGIYTNPILAAMAQVLPFLN